MQQQSVNSFGHQQLSGETSKSKNPFGHNAAGENRAPFFMTPDVNR